MAKTEKTAVRLSESEKQTVDLLAMLEGQSIGATIKQALVLLIKRRLENDYQGPIRDQLHRCTSLDEAGTMLATVHAIRTNPDCGFWFDNIVAPDGSDHRIVVGQDGPLNPDRLGECLAELQALEQMKKEAKK